MSDDPVFERGVQRIMDRDDHWPKEAYEFVRRAVERAVEKAADSGAPGHVAGPQIVDASRELALNDYGPMATYLLAEWQLQSSTDLGHVVFLLIEEGLLAKSDNDRLEDFESHLDFARTLAAPYLPSDAPVTIEKLD